MYCKLQYLLSRAVSHSSKLISASFKASQFKSALNQDILEIVVTLESVLHLGSIVRGPLEGLPNLNYGTAHAQISPQIHKLKKVRLYKDCNLVADLHMEFVSQLMTCIFISTISPSAQIPQTPSLDPP